MWTISRSLDSVQPTEVPSFHPAWERGTNGCGLFWALLNFIFQALAAGTNPKVSACELFCYILTAENVTRRSDASRGSDLPRLSSGRGAWVLETANPVCLPVLEC